MQRLAPIAAFVLAAAFAVWTPAFSQSLAGARTLEDAAAAVLAAPVEERAARFADAVALSGAPPEALLLAVLSPAAATGEIAVFVRAGVGAAPEDADRIVAAALAATPPGRSVASFRPILAAALDALYASRSAPSRKEAEGAEILAVLLSFFPEESERGLAALIEAMIGIDGERGRLLAALDRAPEPGATRRTTRFAGAEAGFFVVAPSTPAQDAPSGN